jgi:methyl farnesoate epoxidase/farnesoate epoxidase
MSQSETNKLFITNYCTGILLTDGPFWVEHRRFTIKHLKDFGFGKKSAEAVILEETEQLMIEMKEMKVVQVSNWF